MQNIETRPEAIREAVALDRDWSIVAACAICLMLSVGTLLLYSFGVFVRPLAKEFHWTRTQISGALTIGQMTMAFTCPLWGLLLDRLGPRRVILPSVAGMSLAFASLSLLTPHVWHLYLVFALFTLLGGGAAPVGYTAVLVRSFERHLGLALGMALMGVGLGASVLPWAAQHLTQAFGWRTAYTCLGIATLVVTVPTALFATRHARLPAAAGTRHAVAVMPLVRTRAFLIMCSIFLMLGIASGGTLAHMVDMMVDRGFTPLAAAKVASLVGIAVLVGRAGIGWLLDRMNAARLLAAIALIVVIALLLLAFTNGRQAGYLAALLVGSVLGAEVDFTAFLVRRYFGNAAFGRLYGLTFGIFTLGVGAGPLLLGMSFDRLGSYRPGLLLFTGLSLVAAVATFAMPRYERSSRLPSPASIV